MSGLWVADGAGSYQKAKQLWVADGSGTYQTARNVAVADGSGTYQGIGGAGGIGGPTITSFTIAKGNPSYLQAVLAWSGNAPGGYQVFLAGSSTPLFSGTASTYTYTGAPLTKYSFRVRAYASDGVSYFESPVGTITLDELAAPQNFRRTGAGSDHIDWAWNAVTGATGYEGVDTLNPSAPTVWTQASGTTHTSPNLQPSTTYERAVRARLGGAASTLSNRIRYTTPSSSGPTSSTYTFKANSSTAAWAYGSNVWRAPSDGIIHGNGAQWGSTFGSHKTFFFYGNHPFTVLQGGRVTRFKIHIQRDSSAGSSAAQPNTFALHNYTVRPAGEPGSYSPIGAGTLAWGQAGDFDLPVAWAQQMIDAGVIGGIVWGLNIQSPGYYMRGPSPVVLDVQGQLSITIG